jgi:hypothetical protein
VLNKLPEGTTVDDLFVGPAPLRVSQAKADSTQCGNGSGSRLRRSQLLFFMAILIIYFGCFET